MKLRLVLAAVLSFLSTVTGCDGKGEDLLKAKAIKIGYTVQGERKTLLIEDAAAVKDLLGQLSFERAEKGRQAGLSPYGTADFVMSEDETVRTMFVRPGQLDRAYWGQLFIDRKFYDAVNKLASKHAGQPIDVLKNN